jgi:hypothetical protein
MKTLSLGKLNLAALGLAAAVLLLPGAALAAAPADTTTALSLSPNPANDGQNVTVTGTTTLVVGGAPVVGDKLQIEMRQSTDTAYDPALGVACDAAGFFKQVPTVNELTDANGQVSKTFDTTGLAGKSICFRAHHPADGGNGTGNSMSAGLNLVIQSSCTGVTLTNPSVSGGTTNPYGSVKGPWTISMTLKICLAARDFKVQGGATAWAPYKDGSASVTAGELDYKVNKKNTVIIWNVNAGEEIITFTVGSESTVIPCGGVSGITQYLSGEWSAAYKDDNNQPAKSDYTARATVSSQACQ